MPCLVPWVSTLATGSSRATLSTTSSTLKRPKLGTPYDVIARRVADLVCELEPLGSSGELGQVTLSVDGTGVGRAVVDMLDAEFKRRGATSRAVPKVDFRRVSVTCSQGSLKRPTR